MTPGRRNRPGHGVHLRDEGRLQLGDLAGRHQRSGGQKQRLSIARALVRRPEIYLFDDSFSALDFKTDAKLAGAQERNRRFDHDHRGPAGQHCSGCRPIIVLDEGRIVGMGTHRELLSRNEVYREIVASQLSEEELAA